MNNPQIPLSIDEIKTASPTELLAAMRRGTEQSLFIKFNKIRIPVRLLTALEEAEVINKSRIRAIEKLAGNGDSNSINRMKSTFTMMSILIRATSIKGDVGFTESELTEMTSDELTFLYDQYVSVCKVVDKEFESMSHDEIKDLIMSVKKKTTLASDYYSWQHAAVGKFFLTEIVPILPEDKDLGS